MEGLQAYVLHANRQAMDLLHSGRIEPAYRLLVEAKRKAETNPGLMAITLNNLGCYYKRIGKPMHALKQLYEALRLESLPPVNSTALAGTHLNICAIRSQLGKHQSALAEALKALEVLSGPQVLSFNTASTIAIAYHNAGVELEYLKRLVEAEDMFRAGWKVVKEDLGEEHPLVKTLLESLKNVVSARESVKHVRGRSLENTVNITLEPSTIRFPPRRKKSKESARPHTRIGFNNELQPTRVLTKSDFPSLLDTLQSRLTSLSPLDRRPLYTHRQRSLKSSRLRPKSRLDQRPLIPAPPPRPAGNISTSQGLEKKVDRIDTQLKSLQKQMQKFATGRLSEPHMGKNRVEDSNKELFQRKLSTPPPPKIVKLVRTGLGAVLKGYRVRKEVKRRVKAVVKLQAYIRKHQCSMLWRNIRMAVVFIQRVWRMKRRKG